MFLTFIIYIVVSIDFESEMLRGQVHPSEVSTGI